MSILQSLEKVRKNLEKSASKKEKVSQASSEVDFIFTNETEKSKKTSLDLVTHKDTNLETENFHQRKIHLTLLRTKTRISEKKTSTMYSN